MDCEYCQNCGELYDEENEFSRMCPSCGVMMCQKCDFGGLTICTQCKKDANAKHTNEEQPAKETT